MFGDNMAQLLQLLPKPVDRQNGSWKVILLGLRTQKWRYKLYFFSSTMKDKHRSLGEIMRLSYEQTMEEADFAETAVEY